eukprot:3933792-Prymnesium_polylepis.1
MTADKRATLWLLAVITAYRHREGCGTTDVARCPILSHSRTPLLPPASETFQMANIPHIVAPEVELSHGW